MTIPDIKRLGDVLIEHDLVTSDQMDMALQKQSVTDEKLGELLVRLGTVSEYDLAHLLADQRGIPFSSSDVMISNEALALFNMDYCENNLFLPVALEGHSELRVIIGNTDPETVRQLVRKRTGREAVLLQGEFSAVIRAIQHHFYFNDNAVDALLQKEAVKLEQDLDQVLSPDKMVEYLLHYAIKERASDIHIQPEEKSLHVLFRIDGVMIPMIALSSKVSRLVTALKLRAEMDISDQIRPQDGSFSINIINADYDVRVSTLISQYGENVVMRLLSGGSHVKGLNELGFYPEDVTKLESLFYNPSGIVLMTGPTGSGKSTTLHAGLRCKGMASKNILTVEDPIEYKLPIICQTEVNRKSGYDFASAIRQFLRHDPDVMLVGEIRDSETAVAAITAAETGHLVLSTIHVNNVMGVFPRLTSLSINKDMIADSLIGVVNQRLARKICPHCKAEHALSEADKSAFKRSDIPDVLYKGVGCDKCRGTGYQGRVPIYEVFYSDETIAAAIAEDKIRSDLPALLKTRQFVPIANNALRRVREGSISIDEVRRLLGSSVQEQA